MSFKSTETIDWESVLSRLQKVDEQAGLSPIDRMADLQQQVGAQVLRMATYRKHDDVFVDRCYRAYNATLDAIAQLRAVKEYAAND